MGTTTSCSSIKTQDTMVTYHPNGHKSSKRVVDTKNRQSVKEEEEESCACNPGEESNNKKGKPEVQSNDSYAEDKLNCSWCQTQFENARLDLSAPFKGSIIDPSREQERDSSSSIDGLSIVSEAERSASSNNLLVPSRLAGSSWSGFHSLPESAPGAGNLFQCIVQGSDEVLTSPDRIDQRSVSCNFPADSPTRLNSKKQTELENGSKTPQAETAATTTTIDQPYATSLGSTEMGADGGSVSPESCSEKNELGSMLVNLRSDSVCTGSRSGSDECDEISLPEEDYQLVDEMQLNNYEVLGDVKASTCRKCSRGDAGQQVDGGRSHLSDVLAPDTSWNQLDSETVTLMDLLQRLSQILVEKARHLMERRMRAGSPHPLRGVRAAGASVTRVENRKRVITLQDGACQYRIRGEFSSLF